MVAGADAYVLLVEDSSNDALLLRDALKQSGASTDLRQARSLNEAHEALRRGPGRPACLIVDLDLPDGDGLSLIDWMHENQPASTAPVIVLSGAPDLVGAAMSRRRASVVLEKPTTLDGYQRLADVLVRLLGSAGAKRPGPGAS